MSVPGSHSARLLCLDCGKTSKHRGGLRPVDDGLDVFVLRLNFVIPSYQGKYRRMIRFRSSVQGDICSQPEAPWSWPGKMKETISRCLHLAKHQHYAQRRSSLSRLLSVINSSSQNCQKSTNSQYKKQLHSQNKHKNGQSACGQRKSGNLIHFDRGFDGFK